MALRNRRLAELALLRRRWRRCTPGRWPARPAHLSRLDNDDTAFNTWVVAWVAHQLPRDPMHLFDAPIFYPGRDTLAFSEHMVRAGAASARRCSGPASSPVLVYNLLVWPASRCPASRWRGPRRAGPAARRRHRRRAGLRLQRAQLMRFATAGAARRVPAAGAGRARRGAAVAARPIRWSRPS